MTVQFSSHTGYAGWRGRAFDAGMIDECVAGLQAIGVLARCAGLLTGYLGKAEIGEAALRALERVRAANREAAYACDPVIGDVGRGRLCRRGRRRILPRPRPAAGDHRDAERLRARMADRRARSATCRRRGRRSPRCARAGRGSWSRNRWRSTTRRPTLSTCSPATRRASGDCARQSCRLRSTEPETCSRRCSFIIGSRRAGRPRRCRARRRRFTRSSRPLMPQGRASLPSSPHRRNSSARRGSLRQRRFDAALLLGQQVTWLIYFFRPPAHE